MFCSHSGTRYLHSRPLARGCIRDYRVRCSRILQRAPGYLIEVRPVTRIRGHFNCYISYVNDSNIGSPESKSAANTTSPTVATTLPHFTSVSMFFRALIESSPRKWADVSDVFNIAITTKRSVDSIRYQGSLDVKLKNKLDYVWLTEMGCALSSRVAPLHLKAMKRKAKKKIVVIRVIVNPVLFDSVPRRSISLPAALPHTPHTPQNAESGLEGANKQNWNQYLAKMESRFSQSKSPLLTHTSRSTPGVGSRTGDCHWSARRRPTAYMRLHIKTGSFKLTLISNEQPCYHCTCSVSQL